MDVAGLAIGMASLYSTCRDCYRFFTTVKTAEAAASTHLRELEIQQSILKAWGFHWQIQNEDSSGGEPEPSDRNNNKRTRTKLHEYLLSNRFKAEGVFKTLSALADTLSDQEKLIKRYGIQLQPVQQAIQDRSQSSTLSNNNVQLAILDTTIENFKPVISEVRNRLSVLNKFKWALKDRDSFKKLIADLRSHSESLYRLCPDTAFGSMNIYLTMDCLARQESPAGLQWTSKLALRYAEADEGSYLRDGYALLASTATLKASVNENRGKGEREGGDDDRILTSIDEEQCDEMWYLGKGLARFQDQIVYVEMRDYRGPPLDLTPEQKQRLKRQRKRARTKTMQHQTQDSSDETEDDEPIEIVRPADPELRALIRNFFNTFQGPNMMKNVYGLDIAGIRDHTEGEHKGHCCLFYKLPGNLGVQTRDRPGENLKLRAPVTLHSLIGGEREQGIQSSLGARFELARKLVRAVCLLHSSGWLHKNIRAESVMFFPELQEDRYELKIEIDVSKPVLMGYIFSRPDDIPIRTDPPSESSRTDTSRGWSEMKSRSITWRDPEDVEAESRRRKRSRTAGIYGLEKPSKADLAKPTKELNVSGFTLDYYQHPAKHADPKRLYRHAYDVYSLGVLLLEIGLWTRLRNYDDTRPGRDEDYYERRRWICREYIGLLRWACGDTYADVVLRCLMADSSDDEVAKASERDLCAKIMADLEGCRA